MLTQPTIRPVLNVSMILSHEYHIEEIYDFFDQSWLDADDLAPSTPENPQESWRRSVRGTLDTAKKKGQALNPRRGYWIRIETLQ